MKANAQIIVRLGNQRHMALWSQALELIQLSGLQIIRQRPKPLQGLAHPLGNLLRILRAPGIKLGVVGANGHHEFHTVEAGQRGKRRLRRGMGRRVRAGSTGAFPRTGFGFVERLRRFQQEALVRVEDGAGALGVGRKNFKIARLPGEDFAESRFPSHILRFRVDDLTVEEPDLARERTVGHFEDRRTLGEALQLDDVHQALALHAAKPAVHLPSEQGLNTVQ